MTLLLNRPIDLLIYYIHFMRFFKFNTLQKQGNLLKNEANKGYEKQILLCSNMLDWAII